MTTHEKQLSSEQKLAVVETSLSSAILIDPDSAPTLLDKLQLECLLILLSNVQPMTTNAIVKRLQVAQILEFLNSTKSREPNSMKGLDAIEKDILEKALLGYFKMEHNKNLSFKSILMHGIQNDYKPEYKLTSEEARVALVNIVNKIADFKIPYYNRINNELLDISNKEIKTIYRIPVVKKKAAQLWGLSAPFYKAWHNKRLQLITDKKAQYADPDLYRDYYLLSTKKHISIYVKHKSEVEKFTD